MLAQLLEQLVDSTRLQIRNGSSQGTRDQLVVLHAHLDGGEDAEVLFGEISQHCHV